MKSRFGWVVWLVVLGVVGFGGQAGADHGLVALADEATIAAGGFEMGCEGEDRCLFVAAGGCEGENGCRVVAERLGVNVSVRQAVLTRVACATGLASTWARESGSAPIPGRDRQFAPTANLVLDKGVQGAGHLRLDAAPVHALTPLHCHLGALADVHTPKSCSLFFYQRSGRLATNDYVDADSGSDGNGGASWVDAKEHLQAAVDLITGPVTDETTIHLKAGTTASYTGDVSITGINPLGKRFSEIFGDTNLNYF